MEPQAALRPVEKLQLLADALSLEFSQSLASEQCSQALRLLLPGLEYLSIGVSNPAQGGAIVASANCATEGPTTLHLHDPQACAAGLALARGHPLQASLLNGSADKTAAAWSDVQLMLAQAPAVTHLLCNPFGPSGSSSNSDEHASPACQHHAGAAGSGTGALLFGFATAPQLDERRKAALAVLARCLPAPMARLSGDLLAFVNFATGSSQQCSCCCCAEEEEEEEEEEAQQPHAPCREDQSGGGGGSTGPSQALRVSQSSDDCAGPSSLHSDDTLRKKLLARGPAEAGGSAQREAHAPVEEPKLSMQLSSPLLSGSDYLSSGPPSPTSSLQFSKALVRAAEEEGAAVTQQSPLTLTFRSPLAEAEYSRWAASLYYKGDILFSLLMLSSIFIIAFVRPYRMVESAPGAVAFGALAFLPVQLAWMHQRAYLTWREWMVAGLRLVSVASMHLVCMRLYQVHLGLDRMQQWIMFWRLTGSESLCVTAIGFRTRLHLHLSLQLAALAVAGWNLASICSYVQCSPHVASGACLKGCAAAAAGFGYLLPTAALRYLEQQSRSLFASRLRAAAAHEP